MPSEPFARAILTTDTSVDIERRQIDAWRSMSTVETMALVNGACRAARTLAMSGLRARYPGASERELVVRLARITLGEDLPTKVCPELADLVP